MHFSKSNALVEALCLFGDSCMSKMLVWLRPFLESGPQPDQLCCMLFINKWPRRQGHNSIHEQVCSNHWRKRVFKVGTTLGPQLDSTQTAHHSQAKARFSALDIWCFGENMCFVFHKSAPRSGHSSIYFKNSTAPRREPKHNKHNKFHTNLIQQNLFWWFDILAP